ncbi:hypothetical protein ACGF13_28480 [Kitasatospora sp. NPDC048286]|uniref:hypothetical protein n=1 Tax=Kitasatospora sp. NPDC048286 TaxID=3364047 RepID=UPI00371AE7F3
MAARWRRDPEQAAALARELAASVEHFVAEVLDAAVDTTMQTGPGPGPAHAPPGPAASARAGEGSVRADRLDGSVLVPVETVSQGVRFNPFR